MITLVHSPFVGSMVWDGVASALREAGHAVAVPQLEVRSSGGPRWRSHVRSVVSAGAPVALVAHSGAGPLVPAIIDVLDTRPTVVFLDATLPHPGRSRLEEMPDDLERRLVTLESRGTLPRWHEWFPHDVLRRLVPDDATRADFMASCPDIPTALLAEAMPETGPLDPARCAYVRLSAAYDPAADEAERLGWHSRRLDLHHLAPLTHPIEVADAISTAIEAVG